MTRRQGERGAPLEWTLFLIKYPRPLIQKLIQSYQPIATSWIGKIVDIIDQASMDSIRIAGLKVYSIVSSI